MLKSVLTNREYQIKGNWYAPIKHLQDFKSVVLSDFWHTSSSAGDWDGWLMQKINNEYFLIPFFQENNWPRGGFTLTTGDILASSDSVFFRKDINQIMLDYEEMYS